MYVFNVTTSKRVKFTPHSPEFIERGIRKIKGIPEGYDGNKIFEIVWNNPESCWVMKSSKLVTKKKTKKS